MRTTLLSTGLIALAALSTAGCNAEASKDLETAYQDARLTGRIVLRLL